MVAGYEDFSEDDSDKDNKSNVNKSVDVVDAPVAVGKDQGLDDDDDDDFEDFSSSDSEDEDNKTKKTKLETEKPGI